MAGETLINGEAHSWSQIEVTVGKTTVRGIKKIAYSETEEMQNNMGQGKFPVSRGTGNVTYEGSMTLHMVEVRALQRESSTGRIQDLEVDVTVAFIPKNGTGIIRDKLEKVKIMANSRDISQGAMEIEVELPLLIGYIRWSD